MTFQCKINDQPCSRQVYHSLDCYDRNIWNIRPNFSVCDRQTNIPPKTLRLLFLTKLEPCSIHVILKIIMFYFSDPTHTVQLSKSASRGMWDIWLYLTYSLPAERESKMKMSLWYISCNTYAYYSIFIHSLGYVWHYLVYNRRKDHV